MLWYVCMYLCMYVRMYVCMYVCMHSWMHACIFVSIYIYICMNASIFSIFMCMNVSVPTSMAPMDSTCEPVTFDGGTSPFGVSDHMVRLRTPLGWRLENRTSVGKVGIIEPYICSIMGLLEFLNHTSVGNERKSLIYNYLSLGCKHMSCPKYDFCRLEETIFCAGWWYEVYSMYIFAIKIVHTIHNEQTIIEVFGSATLIIFLCSDAPGPFRLEH